MVDKEKIAVILPSFDIGGTENMVASLAKNINKNAFDMLIISLSYPLNTHIQKGIENTGVKITYGMKGKVSVAKVFVNVYKELQKFNPDLIHSNMYAFFFVIPYLITHKIKLLHTIHNKPQNEFKDKYKKIISILYKINKAIPVAISDIVEKEMKELYPNLKKIEKVYNPVEVKNFYSNRENVSNGDVIFIEVARFMKQKNHELLLNSFFDAQKLIPEIQLWLVGDGELRESLEAQAQRLGIDEKVNFFGNVNNVNDYLAKADVFVLSSDYEGLPLSVLEAMASGLAIISTNVGGVADIVTDNGILVEAKDRKALTDAMIGLAFNKNKRIELGQKSYENVQQYDCSVFIRRYENLYMKYRK